LLRQYGLAGVVLATHGGQARIEIIAPIVVGLAAVEPTQSAKAAAPRLVFDDLSYGFVGAPIAGPALDLCLAGAGLALAVGSGIIRHQKRWAFSSQAHRGPRKPQLNSLCALATSNAFVA
jgi:hypothetical protein